MKMVFNFFKTLKAKASDDKDYEEFQRKYINCVPLREDIYQSIALPSSMKPLKKKAVRVVILQDIRPKQEPVFIFDSSTPCKDFSKCSSSQIRFRTSGKYIDLKDIVFGNVPLSENTDVRSSMKIHFFKETDEILITKIIHGFDKKNLSSSPTSSDYDEQSQNSMLDFSDTQLELTMTSGHVTIPVSRNGRSRRNNSLSQSPSSVSELQFWSTSPPTDGQLTPSQRSRMNRSQRCSLNVKTRSLPSQNQMHILHSEFPCAGALRNQGPPYNCLHRSPVNLAICVILSPNSDVSDEVMGTVSGSHTSRSVSGTRDIYTTYCGSHTGLSHAAPSQAKWSTRFHSFLFKHFAEVEVLMQGLEDHISEVLATNSTVSERLDHFQKAKYEFYQSLNDLMCTPRLVLPVWLSLTSVERDLSSFSKLPQKQLRETFVKHCLVSLMSKLNVRDKSNFPSRLITGVLMLHLGWIASVVPASGKLEKRCLMKHHPKWVSVMAQSCPYNPLWAQLSDLFGGGGGRSRMARTVIVGKQKSLVTSLLYMVSYFLRCANVSQSEERVPDLGPADLHELQQKVDSGISSQEDLTLNLSTCPSTGSSPTPCTSLAVVDMNRLTYGQCLIAEAAAQRVVSGQQSGMTSSQLQAIKQAIPININSSNCRSISPDMTRSNQWSNLTRNSSAPQFIEIPLLFTNFMSDEDDSSSDSPNSFTKLSHSMFAPSRSSYRARRSSCILNSNGNTCSQDISLGHSMLGGYSERYVNGFALQGTSQSDSLFRDRLIADLRLCLRQASHDEPLDQCSALVANIDERTVQTITVSHGSKDYEIKDVTASSMVTKMLEAARVMSERNTCPEICLQHMETRLQEIYFRTLALCDLLESCPHITNNAQLAAALGVHQSDIPLLLNASTRSPHYFSYKS